MAYTLIAGGLLLSFVFATMNKDWLAGIILGTTLVGSITGLLQSRREVPPQQSNGDNVSPQKKS